MINDQDYSWWAYDIENLAPETDAVKIVFGGEKGAVTIIIDRDESGEVGVQVIDDVDGFKTKLVLGKTEFTTNWPKRKKP